MVGAAPLFPTRKVAPYLKVEADPSKYEGVGTATTEGISDSDADAGGGLAKRVGSFNLLPRTLSSSHMRSKAALSPDAAFPRPDPTPTMDCSVEDDTPESIKPDWRLTDKMKTVGMGLVMALKIGTDPPDVVKPHPCAVLQCWLDPRGESRSDAVEHIGQRLEEQYAKCQQTRVARPLRRRRVMDPTVEDVRNLCLQLRKHARNDRVLFHYNGHGVPRPTANGEIWAFDKQHTEYIPFSIADLRYWLGKPSIVSSSTTFLFGTNRTVLGGVGLLVRRSASTVLYSIHGWSSFFFC